MRPASPRSRPTHVSTASTTAHPDAAADPVGERAATIDPRRRLGLLQDCRELVTSRLSKVVGDALLKMSEELSGLALRSRDPDEQHALMDAVSIVRQHRTEIELRFRRSFSDVFERRMHEPKDGARKAVDVPAYGELALVDDSELQAQLAVERLVHRARGRLDPDEVLGIRARLAALLEREWFEEDRHPASPAAVFEALKSALAEIAPRAEVQSALLDAFEPHVSANLNEVYSSVNEQLKANHVLPRIRPQVVPREGQAARAPQPPESSGSAAWTVEGAVPRPGQGTGSTAGGFEARAGAGSRQQGGIHPGGPAPIHPRVDELDALLSQLAAGAPSARANATRMLADPDLFGVADLPLPIAEPPLLDALTSLQACAAGGHGASPELITDIAQRARENGSPLDQLTVEIVSMVFDYIYADKRLADVVKQQLLRLQVVAVKAALIDRSFFARRAHPMRRLIDRISEVAADADADLGPSSPLVRGIEEVVESVLLRFDRELSIFDEARGRVESLATEERARRAERIAQVTREAERAEAVVHARGLAMARLSDRLDAETPRFVRDFLADWWSLALAEAQVAGAVAALDATEGMAVGEGLIWSVQPKQPDEVPRLAAMLPRLINGLMRGVKMAAMPDERREAFFDELLQAHTRAIAAAKQTAAGRRPTNLKMRSDGRIQFVPVAPPSESVRIEPPTVEARSIHLGELRRGDTLEVDTSGDGHFRSFRLAWISPAQRVFVLSRFPEGAMSVDRAQLAAMFDGGRARLAEGGSALDKAIESVAAASGVVGSAELEQPAQA